MKSSALSPYNQGRGFVKQFIVGESSFLVAFLLKAGTEL